MSSELGKEKGRAWRVLFPADFQSEVLRPGVFLGASPADLSRQFADYIEKMVSIIEAPPKFTLVNVQIGKARTLSKENFQYKSSADYLTVGVEGNTSLVRAIGVIRFSVAGSVLSATLETRETFAAGRSITRGLANWLFPEPDPTRKDANGRPEQGCGSAVGFIIAGAIGFGLVGPWAGPGAGLVAAVVATFVAFTAASMAREQKERHEEEILTIIRLQLTSAYSNFEYMPQALNQGGVHQPRHDKYSQLSGEVPSGVREVRETRE